MYLMAVPEAQHINGFREEGNADRMPAVVADLLAIDGTTGRVEDQQVCPCARRKIAFYHQLAAVVVGFKRRCDGRGGACQGGGAEFEEETVRIVSLCQVEPVAGILTKILFYPGFGIG